MGTLGCTHAPVSLIIDKQYGLISQKKTPALQAFRALGAAG
jgi:hypothetical protein